MATRLTLRHLLRVSAPTLTLPRATYAVTGRASLQHPHEIRSYSKTTRLAAQPYTPPRGADKSQADLVLEELEEQYATAQDEYEIALEETENGTIYAEDDRSAAKEQIEKVLTSYIAIMKGEDREVAEKLSSGLYEKIKVLAEKMAKLEEMAAAHD